MIVEDSKVLILGYTFKENCPDTRNTKVIDVIDELKAYKIDVDVYDPWVKVEDISPPNKINLIKEIKNKYDAIILAVSHNEFHEIDFDSLSHKNTIIFDIKSFIVNKKNKNIYTL